MSSWEKTPQKLFQELFEPLTYLFGRTKMKEKGTKQNKQIFN